jgi:hypothetical protein
MLECECLDFGYREGTGAIVTKSGGGQGTQATREADGLQKSTAI